jgi:cytochrome c55X
LDSADSFRHREERSDVAIQFNWAKPYLTGLLRRPCLLAMTKMALLAWLVQGSAQAADAVPAPDRQRELARFVRQECGFCHGLRLTGGLGSPLTAETMKDRPVELMVTIILRGIPGSAMPGWQPYLNEQDAEWIVQALQKGLLDESK